MKTRRASSMTRRSKARTVRASPLPFSRTSDLSSPLAPLSLPGSTPTPTPTPASPRNCDAPQGSEGVPVRACRAALRLKRKRQRRGAHRVPEGTRAHRPLPCTHPALLRAVPQAQLYSPIWTRPSSPSISPHVPISPTLLACTHRRRLTSSTPQRTTRAHRREPRCQELRGGQVTQSANTAACCLRQPSSPQPKFAEGEFGLGGELGCRRQHAAAAFAGDSPAPSTSFNIANGPPCMPWSLAAHPALTDNSIIVVYIYPPLSALVPFLHAPSLPPHIHSAPVHGASPASCNLRSSVWTMRERSS